MRRCILAALFCAAMLAFCSCSLTYRADTSSVEDDVPDVTFSDVRFLRYAAGRKHAAFSAAYIEQYRGGRRMYAQTVQFALFDDAGAAETSGACGLLAFDRTTGIYELYDDISLVNVPRAVSLTAHLLRWNERTEQLTSGRNDNITLVKDNTTVRGAGFSASAVSNTFLFTGAVSGTIISADKEAAAVSSEGTVP